MKLKKTLIILQATVLFLAMTSTAIYASQVTGVLNSSDVASPVISGSTGSLYGSVVSGTGSEIVGTLGGGGGNGSSSVTGTVTGGSSVSGTVTGGSSGSSGGGGGGGGGSLSGSVSGGQDANQSNITLASNPLNQSVPTTQKEQNFAPTKNNVSANGQPVLATNTLTTNGTAPTGNSNQLAAAVTSGVQIAGWLWWILGLIILSIIIYYIYDRNKNNRRSNKRQ